ncbi:MAG: esterase/lipase family protein [Gemmatimonadaceae bacterium]
MPSERDPSYPVLLIHGYSDQGKSLQPWRDRLVRAGFDARTVRIATWMSLANEISLADVAEAFSRALRIEAGLGKDEPFSVVAHSTGSLVVRAWLAARAEHRLRLRHFIGLAPANFGSPLAHKGRSFLGALAKGNREFSEDFLEVGDRVLDALELGSRYTWDLAHRDLLDEGGGWYGNGVDAPWAYVVCGTGEYGWVQRLFADPPGSDGVVRWAGSALDVRKFTIDLTRRSGGEVTTSGERTHDVPQAFVAKRHHGGLVSSPTGDLERMVLEALRVRTGADDAAWRDRWCTRHNPPPRDAWQQFVVRVRDERGDPVRDYNVQVDATYESGGTETLADFASDVHPYRADPSFRSFHVRLNDLRRTRITGLRLKVLARTNSSAVGYRGVGSGRTDGWDGALDLTELGPQGKVSLFKPFTTTLLEVILDREPLPYSGRNDVFWFGARR